MLGGLGSSCVIKLERCPKMSSNVTFEPIGDRRYAKAELMGVKLFPR